MTPRRGEMHWVKGGLLASGQPRDHEFVVLLARPFVAHAVRLGGGQVRDQVQEARRVACSSLKYVTDQTGRTTLRNRGFESGMLQTLTFWSSLSTS